jgi:hypothetical protein
MKSIADLETMVSKGNRVYIVYTLRGLTVTQIVRKLRLQIKSAGSDANHATQNMIWTYISLNFLKYS